MAESQQQDLKVTFRSETIYVSLDIDASLQDLASACAETIGADVEKVSLFVMPKPGFMKHPFPDRRIADVITRTTRIKVVGTPSAEVKELVEVGARTQAREAARKSVRTSTAAAPSRNRDWRKVQEEAQYTFHAIEPLAYLPNPEKSRRYLERLANDPGIKASMRKHKFSVGLLTEMNPAEHTTHESKTLGLNRNRGEVIELRLRTDRYDGYRDYKVIRKTLCHELSHNVWGEHDRNFWDLTKQIEKEVDQNDWQHGGHKLTEHEFFNPEDDGEQVHDHGGWNGGEFVLGTSSDAANSSTEGLSRREIMARAAIARQEKQKQVDEQRKQEEGS